MTPEDSVQVPGISLKNLFQLSKPSAIRSLIGDSTFDVIVGLDPALAKDERLGSIASQLIEPSEAFRNPELRNQVISLLPLPKARELSSRLGVQDGRDIYRDLCAAAAEKSALETLFSFFGVVRDVRAPNVAASSLEEVVATYGLFDHQRTAASKVYSALNAEPRKVVLHMPTGSGKTRTAMHIVAEHLKNNEPTVVCWLAQNAELLDQAASEFKLSWATLGNRPVDLARFWGNRQPDLTKVSDGFVVAGLAKMAALDNRDPNSMLTLADRSSLIIIDEAHQAIAPTYASVLTALYTKRSRNALLGLTATPGRTWANIDEDQKLSDYFDGQKVTLEIEGYSDPVSFLIDQGYLAKPNFRTLNSNAGLDLSDDDVEKLSAAIDIPDSLLQQLGSDTQRNLRIVAEIEDLNKRHRRTIVFAPSVKNARLLAAILSSRGIDANLVTGETGTSERERIIRRFRSNANQSMVLINYGVLTTGFDAPSTSAAVIARPTRSLVLYSQMVGRATRGPRAGGNAEAEIVTVIDPHLPGFGSVAEAFGNWEDVWHERG